MKKADSDLILSAAKIKLMVRIFGAAVCAAGGLACLGWMKIGTALCFSLGGGSLLAYRWNAQLKSRRITGQYLAYLVVAVALSTFLFPLSPLSESPSGRMSTLTALDFIFLGSALALLHSKRPNSQWLASLLSLPVPILTLPTVVAYLIGGLHQNFSYFREMSLLTSLLLFVLFTGVSLATYESGIGQKMLGRGSTGAAIRKFLLTALGIPILMAMMALFGQSKGLYSAEDTLALSVVGSVFLLIFCSAWSARSIRILEAQKTQAWEALAKINEELEEIVDQRTNEINRSRKTMNLALEAARMGAWEWNLTTNLITTSENHDRLVFGSSRSSKTMDFKTFLAKVHPDDQKRLREELEAALAQSNQYSIEFRVPWPDGSVHLIAGLGKIHRARDGKAILVAGVGRDITEQKANERRIQEIEAQIEDQKAIMISASKLSSLGEMAGGLAHEINTPLTVINLQVDSLMRSVDDDEPKERLMEGLTVIESTAYRIAQIVKGLRLFAKDGSHDPFYRTTIREIIDDTLLLCGQQFKNAGIEMTVNLAREDLHLECRAVQVSQILLNLLNNAYDAVNEVRRKWIRIEAREANGYIELSVTDSGAGIDPSVRGKIMQPFFTTKEIGKGTGLGLSISKGIAEDHKGRLTLDDKSASTRFVLQLPIQQVRRQNFRNAA